MASDELSAELHRWARVAVLCGGLVEDLQITPQASVQCHIGRENNTPWAMTVVNEWINENHLIWTLCAALADSGLDQEWTHRFDIHHRGKWRRIQAMVQETQGAERFLLNIRPPPMLLAVFAHYDGPTARYHAIVSTPASTRPDGGLLDLLRYVYHGDVSSTDIFDVVLCGADTTRIAPELPPYSALGLPDHSIPILNLPPPYGYTPGSDWSELFPERYSTLPPPHRGTSLTLPPPYRGDSLTPPPPYRGSSLTPPPPYRGDSPTPPPPYRGDSLTPPPAYRDTSPAPPDWTPPSS